MRTIVGQTWIERGIIERGIIEWGIAKGLDQNRIRNGPPPQPCGSSTAREIRHRRDTTVGRFGVRLTSDQRTVVEGYLRAGHVRALSHGCGCGKSFVLAYLAALELDSGYSVSYRHGGTHKCWQWASEAFVERLVEFLGPGHVAAAHEAGLIRLFPATDHGHDYRDIEVVADFRDEAFLSGAPFPAMRCQRWAEVGSLPPSDFMFGPPRFNGESPEEPHKNDAPPADPDPSLVPLLDAPYSKGIYVRVGTPHSPWVNSSGPAQGAPGSPPPNFTAPSPGPSPAVEPDRVFFNTEIVAAD